MNTNKTIEAVRIAIVVVVGIWILLQIAAILY